MINRNFPAIDKGFQRLGLEPTDSINYVYFWGPVRKDRDVSKAILSNHFLRPFQMDEEIFNCGEQAMMYHKAKLFGDKHIMRSVMKANTPREQKALGRAVQGFRDTVWNENKYEIVKNIVRAKFQDKNHTRNLLYKSFDNRPRIYVEASPYDHIWGVRLPESDERILHPSTWAGENLLGFIISEVRIELLQNEF